VEKTNNGLFGKSQRKTLRTKDSSMENILEAYILALGTKLILL